MVRFDQAGSSLDFATFLGGDGYDWGEAIALDMAGNTYVSGETRSEDFPTTTGAFDTSYNGGREAFVVKLGQDGSALGYSSFLGGTGSDRGRGIAVDSAGSAYITGSTSSSDFPTTPGAFDTDHSGLADCFVVQLNSAGSDQVFGTYLGGSSNDTCFALSIGGSGSAYVAGWTESGDFPTTAAALDTALDAEDGFVALVAKAPYVPEVIAPMEQPAGAGYVAGNFALAGYAVDLGSFAGIGVDAVHLYLDGLSGSGTFLGSASYGLPRPDVAILYGEARYAQSGWQLVWDTSGVSPGEHDIYVYAHRTTDDGWSAMSPYRVTVLPGLSTALYLPRVGGD